MDKNCVKIVIPKNNLPKEYTYYMRDAQGNIMATYTRTVKRTVDYASLSFAAVNNRIVSQQSPESFAWFTSQVHAGTPYGTTAFFNTLKNSFVLDNSTHTNQFLLNYNLNLSGLLTDPNNLTVAQTVFYNYPASQLIMDAMETNTLNADQLCNCMAARNTANSGFATLAQYLLQNQNLREAFIEFLRNNNTTAYNQLLTDLSIAPTNPGQEILDINTYISSNGNTDLMISLNSSINFSDCGGMVGDFVMSLGNPMNPTLLAELSNIPEFNELMLNTGNGTVSFSCAQGNLEEWFNMLSYRNPSVLMNLVIANAPGSREEDRKAWVVNWFRNNDPATFVYTVSLMNASAIGSAQTANAPLYASTTGAADMQQYFEQIRQKYGNSFYDQMFTYFASNSNLYVDSLKLDEWHIYGSSRLGVYEANGVIAWRQAYDANHDNQLSESEYSSGNANSSGFLFASLSSWRGNKHYEMSNHLGNVLAVISDKKLIVCSNNTFSGYTADVISATDYSPFGAPMAGRSYSSESYRFGFNGKEKDNETYGDGNEYDYGFRIYNPRLGRFLSEDPLSASFPWYTPFQFAGNKPTVAIDLDGLEEYYIHEFFLINSFGQPFLYRIDFMKVDPNDIQNNTPGSVGVLVHRNFKTYSGSLENMKKNMRSYGSPQINQVLNPTRNQQNGGIGLRDYSGEYIKAIRKIDNGIPGTINVTQGVFMKFKDNDGIAKGEVQKQFESPANKKQLEALDNLAIALVNDPNFNVTVIGFASPEPTNFDNPNSPTSVMKNEELAMQRAIAGKAYLLDYIKNNLCVDGFDESRIKVVNGHIQDKGNDAQVIKFMPGT